MPPRLRSLEKATAQSERLHAGDTRWNRSEERKRLVKKLHEMAREWQVLVAGSVFAKPVDADERTLTLFVKIGKVTQGYHIGIVEKAPPPKQAER